MTLSKGVEEKEKEEEKYNITSNCFSVMRFSSALISFLSSLPATSVAMAMEEPHDSVLHDVTASILEESLEVRYKNKKSHLEPLKIQNSNDGRPHKANDVVELADDKGGIMQKKEMIHHHLVDHQEHQEGKSLEECNISPTTTATAAATSDNDSLMERKIFSDKESITKMDYGHLNRGTCLSPNDACVPQQIAIEGNGAFLELEDTSYASSGYCVPRSVLEDMEYSNVVASTSSLIDKEEFNKEEEMTESYYHNQPQYDQHHRQLDSLNCNDFCSGERQDVSSYVGSFNSLTNCYINGVCRTDYPDISCWNTANITDMKDAFSFQSFNAPLECWNVGQVTSMDRMFFYVYSFNQLIDSWDVSQVEYMSYMFDNAYLFNQHIDSWDVSQVKNMDEMFNYATSFNKPIDTWNVSQVTYLGGMFYDALKFNQAIDSWNVSQVETMRFMFSGATSFNQPIGDWNTLQVRKMDNMFSNATSFNQPLDTWDVSRVYTMYEMFRGGFDFNQCLSTWAEKTDDTVYTTDMLYGTDCPNGIDNPDATIGPWCQDYKLGCFAPGFEPSQQPSVLPSNKPTDVPTKPPTNAPTNSQTTKGQKKKSIKKTKKQDKKKSKKM